MSKPIERFDIRTDCNGGRNWFVELMPDGPFCHSCDYDEVVKERDALARHDPEREEKIAAWAQSR